MASEIPYRLIAKIEIKNGYVVKGLMMEGVERVGDPIEFAKCYYKEGADELILLDTVASLYQRIELPEIISNILEDTFLPICAGGGITSLDQAELLFRAGADKVCVNTGAIENPSLLKALADRFGSQSIVSQIDAKLYRGQYMIFTNSGRDLSNYDLVEWMSIIQQQGVGEVLLTSIDKDGLSRGIDVNLIKLARSHCDVPLIYGGGVSNVSDIALSYKNGSDGCAIASAFHFKDLNIANVKDDLSRQELSMRL